MAGTGHPGSWEKSGIWLTAPHFQITNAPGVLTSLSATWVWSEPLDHALDSSVQQFPDKWQVPVTAPGGTMPSPRLLGEMCSQQAEPGMLHPAVAGVCMVQEGGTKM